MSTIENAIETTIDRAGRIIIPKAIRDAIGLRAGITLLIRCRNGIIEAEPVFRKVRMETRGRLAVAVPVEDSPDLSSDEVNETMEKLRNPTEG
jgi:AbrB family looped-hinge helix DNA binding protein